MPFFSIGNSLQPNIFILPQQKSFDSRKKSQYGSIEENSVLVDQDQFNQDEFGTSQVQGDPLHNVILGHSVVVDESHDEENDVNNINDISTIKKVSPEACTSVFSLINKRHCNQNCRILPPT